MLNISAGGAREAALTACELRTTNADASARQVERRLKEAQDERTRRAPRLPLHLEGLRRGAVSKGPASPLRGPRPRCR